VTYYLLLWDHVTLVYLFDLIIVLCFLKIGYGRSSFGVRVGESFGYIFLRQRVHYVQGIPAIFHSNLLNVKFFYSQYYCRK
jgi:hypothetical protein